jgi:hypothetical protein
MRSQYTEGQQEREQIAYDESLNVQAVAKRKEAREALGLPPE